MSQWEKNEWEKQVIGLTCQMMRWHYCENNVEAMIGLMDEDIIWQGVAEHEFAAGKADVTEFFRRFAGMIPKCIVSEEDYQAMMLAPDVFLCTGRLWIRTDPSTGISLRVHQRVTIVFRLREGQLRCCHIHASNPYADMTEEDLGFPIKMAKQSYQYLQEQLAIQKKQIRMQTEQLKRMSYEDALTGLYNRHKFNEIIDADRKMHRARLGIACLDLNGLKRVNDQLGHLAGDDLLRRAAAPLRHLFGGRAYRIGGDEFVVLDDVLTEAEFYDAIGILREEMKKNDVSCAVGVSWRGENCSALEQIDEADRLMYEDKKEYYRSLMQEWIQQGGE